VKKGVRFAKLFELKESSPERITPDCPHFNQCNGCDYQHTNYQKELEYKKQALARHLSNFPLWRLVFTELRLDSITEIASNFITIKTKTF